jgi:hypothetical protein
MAKMGVETLARDVEQALGDKLVALVLYGSHAREEKGGANANTLLIARAVDDALFAALDPALRAWTRAGHEAPLIFSEREWQQSSDVFAIEYEDIREAYRVLAGRDPWTGITVRREDVRRQLEAELMGKLVRLRQAYAAARDDGRRLTGIVAGSAPGVFTMLRAALRLGGRPVPRPSADMVREAATLVSFPAAALDDVVAHVAGTARLALTARDPRAAAFLDVVARTAAFVDRLT